MGQIHNAMVLHAISEAGLDYCRHRNSPVNTNRNVCFIFDRNFACISHLNKLKNVYLNLLVDDSPAGNQTLREMSCKEGFIIQ